VFLHTKNRGATHHDLPRNSPQTHHNLPSQNTLKTAKPSAKTTFPLPEFFLLKKPISEDFSPPTADKGWQGNPHAAAKVVLPSPIPQT
jgi:hypothetical protein